MAVVLANNGTSTLSKAITATETAITLPSEDAVNFPTLNAGDWHPLTVLDFSGQMEIMRVTERNGAVLTVVRGQEGTSAKAFPIASIVDLRLTVEAIAAIKADAMRMALNKTVQEYSVHVWNMDGKEIPIGRYPATLSSPYDCEFKNLLLSVPAGRGSISVQVLVNGKAATMTYTATDTSPINLTDQTINVARGDNVAFVVLGGTASQIWAQITGLIK